VAAVLSADEPDLARRFAGLDRLYGVTAAAAVRAAHVAVVGVGGVGSWAVESLARSGVGALTLIDLDHVAESNVNRQIHATSATLGQAKVLAMKDRIAQINPACRVTAIEEFVDAGNWPQLLPDGVTAVIDACDQPRAKLAMAAQARLVARVHVAVGAAGGKRHAHKVQIDDLARVTHDPLLAKLRNQLRREHAAPREGRSIGLSCVFSPEPVQGPHASCALDESGSDGSLNCAGFGSLVSVTATFGHCAAGWVLEQLAQGHQ
jgi:tRNA A37 threonylcarbamoyladenosine dehydratase